MDYIPASENFFFSPSHLFDALAEIITDSTENKTCEQSNMPEDQEEPEGIIKCGTLWPIRQIGIHGRKESLGQTSVLE